MSNEDKIPEVTHELPLHPPAKRQQRETQECGGELKLVKSVVQN